MTSSTTTKFKLPDGTQCLVCYYYAGACAERKSEWGSAHNSRGRVSERAGRAIIGRHATTPCLGWRRGNNNRGVVKQGRKQSLRLRLGLSTWKRARLWSSTRPCTHPLLATASSGANCTPLCSIPLSLALLSSLEPSLWPKMQRRTRKKNTKL